MKQIGVLGKSLLNKYMKTLHITEKLAQEMINRNVIAYSFITDEECLNLCSEEENLNMLLSITLFRDDYDREPLKKEEIEILKDSYNIIYEEKKGEANNSGDNFTNRGELLKFIHENTNHRKIEQENELMKKNENKLDRIRILETVACACIVGSIPYYKNKPAKKKKITLKPTRSAYKARKSSKKAKSSKR